MIQRKQSIFLFLAAALILSLLVLPISSSSVANAGVYNDGIWEVKDQMNMLGGLILGAVCSLLAIFLFKNRSWQIRLILLGILAVVVMLIFGILSYLGEMETLPAEAEVDIKLGSAIPLIILILLALAIKFIRKDERLVRSMDRLR